MAGDEKRVLYKNIKRKRQLVRVGETLTARLKKVFKESVIIRLKKVFKGL